MQVVAYIKQVLGPMRIIIPIILLLLTTPLLAQRKPTPIRKLSFDKIVAFNYNLPDDTSYSNWVDQVVVDGQLHNKLIQPGKALSSEQQIFLINILNDRSSYGIYAMACYEPRLTFVFYNKEKIVGHVDICFECNQLRSSMYIPKYNGVGFSDKGFINLLKLCNDLNMIFCFKAEEE